jgi:hypothetical protein
MTATAVRGARARGSAFGRSATVPVADRRTLLHLGLLRHLESVVDLDAEVPDGAFQLGMPR